MLNKEQIKQSQDINFVDVDIPEWGGQVRVKSLGVADQISFEHMMSSKADQHDLMIFLVVKSCVDEKGALCFDDSDKEWLLQKSSKAILKIWQAALDLNYASDKKIEEVAKNS